MNKILVVEDEIAIAELIRISLTAHGYIVDVAMDGEQGANDIEKKQYDLILLDIMLPRFNGYELLEYAKLTGTPVIFVSAKGQLKDKVKGLHMGADDYIVKPFEIDELIARVQSVIRRSKHRFTKGDITIDMHTRMIQKDTKEIKLTPKEFDLFLYLFENQGRILTREQILEAVWNNEIDVESRTIDLHIQRIRKKLDIKDTIKTMHKIGYIFEV